MSALTNTVVYASLLLWLLIVTLMLRRRRTGNGSFPMNAAPGPATGMISSRLGRGAATWIGGGMTFGILASTLAFIDVWMQYDATALGTQDAARWQAAVLSASVLGFLAMTLIGVGLAVIVRSSGQPLVSERNVALMAAAWGGTTLLAVILAFAGRFELPGLPVAVIPSGGTVFAVAAGVYALYLLILLVVFVYAAITMASSEREEHGVAAWHAIIGLAALLWALAAAAAQTLWIEPRLDWIATKVAFAAFTGLALSGAYTVVTRATGQPVWSSALATVGVVGLSITLSPLGGAATAGAEDSMVNLTAAGMLLGVLPIIAAGANVLLSVRQRWDLVATSPGLLGVAASVILLMAVAAGSLFTATDAVGVDPSLGGAAFALDRAVIWGALGFMGLVAAIDLVPGMIGHEGAPARRTRALTCLLIIGAVGGTVAGLIGAFGELGLVRGGIGEADSAAVHAPFAGAWLIQAVLFYAVPVAMLVGALALMEVLRADDTRASLTDRAMRRVAIGGGHHSLRTLLAMGLSAESEFVMLEPPSDEGDEGTIEVEAALSGAAETTPPLLKVEESGAEKPEEAEEPADEPAPDEEGWTEDDLVSMLKKDLVALAEEHGMSTEGTKADITARLLESQA